MPVTVKFEKISSEARIPQEMNPGDALDLYAAEDKSILIGDRAAISTGLKIEMEPHIFAFLTPRSGLALNHGITVLNSPGLVDPGFRGELKVILVNHGSVPFHVSKGDRIAQLSFLIKHPIKVLEAKVNVNTERGEKGYGSTGIKEKV